MVSTPDREAAIVLGPVAAGRTDVGRKRGHNEDQVLLRDELGLFAVADGMGGHDAGDVASAVTAEALNEFFATTAEGLGEVEGPEDLPAGARRLVASVHHANRSVFGKSGRSATQGGMGSTVVALHASVDEQQMHICHVGDSRCYRLRDGVLEQLTADHSMINEALKLNPDLSPEILKQLPSNVVTRALGTKDSVEPDIRTEPLVAGDLYLLCSDGLSGEVSDEEIHFALEEESDLDEACALLIAMANEAGGRDNISVVLVRVDPFGSEPGGAVAGGPAPLLDADEEDELPVPPAVAEPAAVELIELADEDLEDEPQATTRDLPPVVEDEAQDEEEDLPPPPALEPSDGEAAILLTKPSSPRVAERRQARAAAVAVLDAVVDDVLAEVDDVTAELDGEARSDAIPQSVESLPIVAVAGEPSPEPVEVLGGELLPRRCQECGHKLLPEEHFCGMCGAPVRDELDEAVACCDDCGHEILLGTNFCVECGAAHGFGDD